MTNDHTNIKELIAAVSTKADLALKFYFNGSAINPGYHVTEVKHAAINSVDCGRSSKAEQWDEITVQLLDGSAKSKEGHMSASKFSAIIGAALKSLPADTAPYLFFEFAPDNGPIRKLSIESIEFADNEVAVSLGSEQAVCKPFQRAKAAKAAAALSGGAAVPASYGGCCADGNRADGSACC